MLTRVVSGIVALVLTGLAVGLPIVLTEAGTSKSTYEAKNVFGSFQFTDSSTGDHYSVWVWASERTSTYSSPGAGNPGSKSNRPHGSPRNNGGFTYSYEWADVQIDQYDSTWNLVTSYGGSAEPTQLSIASDLSSASLQAEVTVYDWMSDPWFPVTGSTVHVDLTWTATGSITTYRSNDRSQTLSPRSRYHSISRSRYRDADANGQVLFDSVNLASDGSQWAEISESSGRSMFQY